MHCCHSKQQYVPIYLWYLYCIDFDSNKLRLFGAYRMRIWFPSERAEMVYRSIEQWKNISVDCMDSDIIHFTSFIKHLIIIIIIIYSSAGKYCAMCVRQKHIIIFYYLLKCFWNVFHCIYIPLNYYYYCRRCYRFRCEYGCDGGAQAVGNSWCEHAKYFVLNYLWCDAMRYYRNEARTTHFAVLIHRNTHRALMVVMCEAKASAAAEKKIEFSAGKWRKGKKRAENPFRLDYSSAIRCAAANEDVRKHHFHFLCRKRINSSASFKMVSLKMATKIIARLCESHPPSVD